MFEELEEWVTLLNFPMYQISNYGNVLNKNTGKKVAISYNKQNVAKVALINDNGRHTRSVAVLVANIFVHGQNDIFDTVIHLDGDLRNCEATNLMWRPRWFAYQYHRQFTYHKELCLNVLGQAGPIIEKKTNTMFSNVYEVCISYGLLIQEVNYKTSLTNELEKRVWPTNQIFDFGSRI